jgi:outer membrane protein
MPNPLFRTSFGPSHSCGWIASSRFVLLLLLVFSMKSSGGEVLVLSLDEAINLALRGNETVLVAEANRSKAEGAVIEARAGALPQLSLQGSYQGNFKKPAFFAPEEFGGGKLEMGSDIEVMGQLRVDQVLYAFGRVGNALEFAGIYRDIADRGVRMAQDDVIFQCREAYLRLLLLDDVLDITRRTHEQLDRQLTLVGQRHEQGTVSRFELLRSEVELKNHLPGLIRANNNLELSRQDFLRITGLPEGTEFRLVDSLVEMEIEFDKEIAYDEALAARPEIQALELGVQGAEKILAIRRAGRLPVLGAFGQFIFQGQSDRHHPLQPFDSDHRAISSSAGLTVQIPLFDGLRTNGQVQQAGADLRRSQYQLDQARRGVRLEVNQALQDLESLKQELASMSATVGLAEEAFAIAQSMYDNGLSIQLELSDARVAMDLARMGKVETLYRYNVALARVDRILGRSIELGDELTKE